MLADALAQYLIWKQWRKWFFVVGSHPEDRLWADALKRSGARFGAKIVEERISRIAAARGAPTAASTLVQKQIPAFTQERAAYDVLVAADESAVFADYLPYRTWDPRPVAGFGRPRSGVLGRLQRAMGRDPVAAAVRAQVPARR